MILNFEFNLWSKSCKDSIDECIQVIATHEFGHAIGLAHEQNRDDAPDWCKEEQQGSDGDWKVTVYDPDSIMNYCCKNCWTRGRGKYLSEKDIDTAQALYGKIVSPVCVDAEFDCMNPQYCSYSGLKNTTSSGKACQFWNKQSPHKHSYAESADNNCKVFDKDDGGPWCYTQDTDVRWDHCYGTCSGTTSASECVDRSSNCINPQYCSYSGMKSSTVSGKTCQAWNQQSPHKHKYTSSSDNYCRVFEASDGGPWCYTMDSNVKWEYCFHSCTETANCVTAGCAKNGDSECKKPDAYRGTRSTTVSGKICQRWDSQSPHKHTRNKTADFPDNTIHHNYCRNPDRDPGPWCYTTDPDTRWEICFPDCTTSACINTAANCMNPQHCDCSSNTGTATSTVSGKTCQAWSAQAPHAHLYPSTTDNYCRVFYKA